MASTRKPRNADPASAVRRALAALDAPRARIAVGLSGGVDSVVLLHLMRELAPDFRLRLSAIHVNHGISRHALQWERYCAALCRGWKLPLAVRRVKLAKRGEGLEAAARAARRAAYAALQVDAVALAHHLDDQAETLLLALLRGTGLRGAGAMPELGRLGDKRLLRPLLGVPREEILAYAGRHGLAWVEDESNADTAYTRNFLRAEIAPLLSTRFPRWRENLARAARHFAAKELTREDLLRAFLAEQGLRAPSEAKLADMLRQIGSARADARVAIAHDGATLRTWRGALRVTAQQEAPAFVPLRWRGESRLALPALGGSLRFRRARGGIDAARIPSEGMAVGLRRGGERLRPDAKRPSRTLKNLFQEAGIPAWERERLPLLYCGRDLVWAPGLGVDAAYATQGRRLGWLPEWQAR
ncbi:MAG: tRNA lysidine(34) synthetase TilS [Burkholderiales bacterium]